ncbi:conserved hypothetical protein [delta proteobacterium NaphS2]|nr:conserved hypothetical protein [delta proteobacterium NaphS2]
MSLANDERSLYLFRGKENLLPSEPVGFSMYLNSCFRAALFNRIKYLSILFAVFCIVFPCQACCAPTWLKVEKIVYGAKPEGRGPIGGGKGYANIIIKGDYTIRDLDGLLKSLAVAKKGEVVFIPGETVIDLTARIYIEKLVLNVPEGVTLAGDRGYKGSKGALLTSDALKTPVMIQAAGSNVRITGLRIRGPNPKRYLDHHRRALGPNGRGRKYYYMFPVSIGILSQYPSLEVDNCEISAFSHSGIRLANGMDHNIHHNFIHHCQYNGLGYGVSSNTAQSLIEYNLFNWNRHSIAGTGRPGCSYVARHNIQLEMSLSHCFDMHGGRDRHDGTDTAGTSIEIYNNTFYASQTPVVIRGIPENGCKVYHNRFPKCDKSTQAVSSYTRTAVFDNLYGEAAKATKK